jgi:hypothetical protein
MTDRPRKGRPLAFRPENGVPPRSSSDSILGLRFAIEAAYGGRVLVDLLDLQPRRLAIGFAGALRRAAESGGSIGAASVVKQHVQGYRRFFTYLRAYAAAVEGSEDLRAEHLDGFNADLEAGGLSPIHRHTILAKAINALRGIDTDSPGILDEVLRRRLAYTSSQSVGRSRPRDAYSPFVARHLRDAARADVARIIRRLQDGPVIESDAVLQRVTAKVHGIIARHGRIGHDHLAFKSLYFMRLRRSLPVSRLIEDVHGRHYLTAADLPPFLVLLSLETGLEIECGKALTIDCLRNASAGVVDVAYIKRRARGAEHKTIKVRDGGVGTPGGLIRRIIEVTAAARHHHAGQALWVHHRCGALTDQIGHSRETIDAWTRRHGVVDDESRPLRLVLSRLRKTHKALWYLKTEGHMARFAVGHTPEVAARHYADVPSLRPLHEAAAADAFTEAVARSAPIVLTTALEEAWRRAPPSVHADGPVQVGHVAALLNGEQDVWLASCASFYDSPFDALGSPCPQPFWGCLDCGNAVITTRKLPAILAFLTFIEMQREALTAADWSLKFGRAHARITTQVLPVFSDADIAQARALITDHQHALYLPPEAHA